MLARSVSALAAPFIRLRDFRASVIAEDEEVERFAEAALARHKREGMVLAFRARLVAMAVIIVMLPTISPDWSFLWFQGLAIGFIAIGWVQQRVARVGQSRAEMAMILCDLVLMTVAVLVPNPFAAETAPIAMWYRNEGFKYFFVLLAFGTLAYTWRTVWGIGVIASALWGIAFIAIWIASGGDQAEGAASESAVAYILAPGSLFTYQRVQEIVVFLIVAATLAMTVRRYGGLVRGHAALARERANLARYFSPNVVEELSSNDEPLKTVRTQNVAVLFVDIVGFTRFAADRSSVDVIETLRAFHKRMEAEVFAHEGTLDKYLGDGLMATFGTPFGGERDATHALCCARAMIRSVEAWNDERAAAGEARIRASFGLHYGPAVLGDIGSNRLEFAVIGNTVNVASRVEALTRALDVTLAATEDLCAQVRAEGGERDAALCDLERQDGQEIRGIEGTLTLWTCG